MGEYSVLSQDEQDDIVVSFMEAQERDLFSHRLNLERFDKMLSSLPEGKWKSRISDLRAETASRIAEVESIITATKGQLPTAGRIEAAKSRLQAKVKKTPE